ncbi:MAG: hypothetical protein IPL28_26795 [Chloroflexi bacterium]|nr:hypothetical protein [Chloroflexota bacterium]
MGTGVPPPPFAGRRPMPCAVVQTLLHQNYLTTNQNFPPLRFCSPAKAKHGHTRAILHGLSDIG